MTILRECDMTQTIEEQAQLVFAILEDVHGQFSWTPVQILADLRRMETHYFYIHKKEEVAGFLAIQKLYGEIEITNLAIKKQYQRQGLASKLLAVVLESSDPIFLEVRASNQAAQKLYEQSGFKHISVRKNYYHNPVEDAILMKGNEG